ncbi:hypothetical protein JKA74_14365 [Marivirga sp. S37H4]|uniref:Uncharacterized protein n=1 Tax=Marivirga aurantiaca TaxID=2802615 RepID=A0A934X0F8_9BACT|nr:hypothetical protein [Marivirga aurantiaca]MBK6266226.1 hypothetical protein [Marivirga aurantiaca]
MRKLLILLSFISLAATCQDKKSSDAKTENPCDPDIMCTMVFATVDVQIVNEAGEPVKFDKYYSVIDGEIINLQEQDDYQQENGYYPVATDNEMSKVDFEGTEVEFVGEKNGKEIISTKMIIGKDCCHIQKISGDETIVVFSSDSDN